MPPFPSQDPAAGNAASSAGAAAPTTTTTAHGSSSSTASNETLTPTDTAANGTKSKKTFFSLQSKSGGSGGRDGRRLPHRLRQETGSDEDEVERVPPEFELVTGFDSRAGGAVADGRGSAKQELVIPVTSNNNWRDRPGVNIRKPQRHQRKDMGVTMTTTTTKTGGRKKNLLPKEVQTLRAVEAASGPEKTAVGHGESTETDRPNTLVYGLSYAPPPSHQIPAVPKSEDGGGQQMQDAKPLVPPPGSEAQRTEPLSQDELALQELIRESKGETTRKSDLVIDSVSPMGRSYADGGKEDEEKEEEEDGEYVQYNETSSFRADVASRPESASLEAYNAIPVEEFGAALLRGMGWKEGQAIGRGNYNANAPSDRANRGPRIPERRPGFLGIGAKDVSGAKGAEVELGAWGKAAMRKSSKNASAHDSTKTQEGVYMPVMMRHKKTGELISEEELSVRRKEASRGSSTGRDDKQPRRDSSRTDHSRQNSGRYDGRRSDSPRRERSFLSTSRHRHQRHDDDDFDGDDDHKRATNDRYYRDRDRDLDRDRDRHLDRYRDRDRDRDAGRESYKERSSKIKDDDRHTSRHSTSLRTSTHRDGRESDRESYRRRRDGR